MKSNLKRLSFFAVILGALALVTSPTLQADPCVAGETWIMQTNDDTVGWQCLASSSDGSRLVAGVSTGGLIYTSTDYGMTWTAQNSGNQHWFSLASSSDGSKLVAGVNGGQIYTSTDFGTNWTAQNSGSLSWYAVASSSDGSKLVALANGGVIFTSTDSGTNWTAQNSGSQSWYAVASSSDGSRLVASAGNGGIYTSTDFGTNWTFQAVSGETSFLKSVASSSDGSKLVAVGYGGIFTSVNYGTNWTEQNNGIQNSGSQDWWSVGSSSDGSKLVAGADGSQIYTSTDNGTNWTAQNSGTQFWERVVSSSDGTKLAALVAAGAIYTSDCFSAGTFALGTTALLEGPSAGSNSVVLAASPATATWSNTANASWLHLSAANQNGTGSTNVIFSYDANTSTTRTGTLTIAGLTLTVTQAGSTYVQALGPVTTLLTGVSPQGIAVDGSGNVYFGDNSSAKIEKWTVANNELTTLVSLVPGDSQPAGVAVDGAGNVYFSDYGQNKIKKWTAATSNVTTLVSTSQNTDVWGVAVDGAGDVYFDYYSGAGIWEWNAASNTVTELAGTSAVANPQGLAMDVAGNIYAESLQNHELFKWTAANSNLTTLSTQLDQPIAVAVDGAGNVYIADFRGNIFEWTAASRVVTTLVSSGLNEPEGVAVDGAGNVYISDSSDDALKELPYALVDPTPKDEGGNAGSDVLPSVLPTTANLNGPFYPTSSQPWLTITGVTNGVVGFAFTTTTTNRAANITLLGQSITVTQSVQILPVVTWTNPAPIIYGTALSPIQLNATANVPGTFYYYPPAATVLTAGTNPLSAVFTPSNSMDYISVTNFVSLVVLQATPVVTWPTPSPIVYGTALSAIQLDATANVPGTFSYNPSAGTVLPVGTSTLSTVFDPSNSLDYISVSDSVSLLVTNAILFLPVYQVTQAGATFSQATNLAALLNIPSDMLVWSNGLAWYVDRTNYLLVPTTPITNAIVISNLTAVTKNPYPAIPLNFEAIDFATLTNMSVLDSNVALSLTANALASSNLNPQFGTPTLGHSIFTAFCTNDDSTVSSTFQYLDTQVNYQFTDTNGYPLVGPGAQVQLNYGASTNVTRLLYSTRQLQAGPSVQIISLTEASNRVANLLPANAQFTLQLVYWCPSLLPPWPPCYECPTMAWNPMNIIPWYTINATINETNPATGAIFTSPLEGQMILATDDTNYVPSIILVASQTATQVVATVSVSGGKPPYTYTWGGSAQSVSTNNAASNNYTPMVRVVPPPLAIALNRSNSSVTVLWPYPSTGFVLESNANLSTASWSLVNSPVQNDMGLNMVSIPDAGTMFLRLRLASNTLPTTETVAVTVTDADGVSVHTNQTFTVQAVPFAAGSGDPPVTYGTESPYDAGGWDQEQALWLGFMGLLAPPGSQAFLWTQHNSNPGDFQEPVLPNSLQPIGDTYSEAPFPYAYIYADADFSFWGKSVGVNTANLVMYLGHGGDTGFSFTFPNFPKLDGSAAFNLGLDHPGMDMTATYGEGNDGNGDNYNFQMEFTNAWGNQGPNDELNWLAMYCCSLLQYNHTNLNDTSPPSQTGIANGVYAWQRWGPAFNGLHILMGYETEVSYPSGTLGSFAFDMLGLPLLHLNSLPIAKAWIEAGYATQGNRTVPAAMGTIGPSGCLDYNDYYPGYAPSGAANMGPSIPAYLFKGYWYMYGEGFPACLSAPPGQLNWWRAEGNALDSVGGDNGTLNGGVTYASGEVGQAFSFDGSTGFVSTSMLINNPQTFTLSLWFRTSTQAGALMGFASSGTGSSGSFDRIIYMDNVGALNFGVWSSGAGAAQVINSSTGINGINGIMGLADGQWHQVMASLSASTGLSLYVDGVLRANNPSITSAQVYNGYWRIGEESLGFWPDTAGDYFNGQIDEVSIFNNALPAADALAIFLAKSAGMCN
jgi:hypothetical protein